MIYITSHSFEFGVETMNDHGGDWVDAAASNVKDALDAMGADRVRAIHANLRAGASGETDELIDDCHEASSAGALVNEYEDFVVELTAH